MKKVLGRIGTILVGLGMLGGGALVFWNVFGMGPYADTCSYSIGCKSFYCLHHEVRGADQVPAAGHCTKSCDSDGECGTGAVCVKLGDDARDDLPPFGKPDKACMVLQLTPAPTR